MNVLVLGANSDIAYAVAEKFANLQHADITLASRNMELLEKKEADIRTKYGVQVRSVYFDALDAESHADFYKGLDPKPDVVLLSFGVLGDQEKAQADFNAARRIIETNYTGAVSILEIVAADFETKRSGTIIGVGSVAGERGRRSNYIYGSAKGAFLIYLSGLRNRLFKNGVHVLTVLPGFVNTAMTEGMDLPGALTLQPEDAAGDIHSAFLKKKNVVYTGWFWKYIMMIIKAIPEFLFKRLSL